MLPVQFDHSTKIDYYPRWLLARLTPISPILPGWRPPGSGETLNIIVDHPPRTEGGLGKLDIPLLSDLTHAISKDYGVYLEENGHTLRGLFIIDPEGTLRSQLLCLREIT